MLVSSHLASSLLSELEGKKLPSEVELPPLPHVVTQFCMMARNEETGIADFIPILEQDSGFTYDLLKYCNSSHLGLRNPVCSVKQAMGVLGINRVKFLLLRSSVKKMLKAAPSGMINLPLLIQESWERALFAQHAAEVLKLPGDYLLTAVILQDFLLPFLCSSYPEEYQRYFKEQLQSSIRLVEFEQETFGWTHAELAALSMQQWHFPEELILSVLLHHRWDEIVNDPEYSMTPAMAIVAGASLPDELNQEPGGFTRLMQWEENCPNFDLLDALQIVDEQLPEYLDAADTASQGSSLLVRCNELLFQTLHQHTTELGPGTPVGSYQVTEILGRGGMGLVYLANHSTLNREAVIKVLDSERITTSTIDSFEKEVLLTSKLTHPNTVTIYDYGRLSTGAFYYAMEYVEGLSLKQLVEQAGPITDGRVIFILKQVCAALSEAHHYGLVHRDIKPDNIMISHRGRLGDFVTVLDFGLVSSIEELQQQSNHSVCGTPHYLSPEAIRPRMRIDARSDLYSLGAMAYYLLTGETLFQGEAAIDIYTQHLSTRPKELSETVVQPADEKLCEVLMQCLEKDADDRPQSVDLLLQSLSNIVPENVWDNATASEWWEQCVPGNPVVSKAEDMDWDAQTIPGEF